MTTKFTGLVSLTLALVLVALTAPKAIAGQVYLYTTPAVFASAATDATGSSAQYFDGLLIGQIGDLEPRDVKVSRGTSSAWAFASLDQIGARAYTGPQGGASGRVFLDFVVQDPQNRELVKVQLGSKLRPSSGQGFKGAATTLPPLDPAIVNGASVHVFVYPGSPPRDIELDSDNQVISVTYPLPESSNADFLQAFAFVQTYWGPPEQPGGPQVCCISRWRKRTVLYNAIVTEDVEGDGPTVTLEVNPTLLLRPGRYMIDTGAGGVGFAIIDPIVVPHPDNPDVVIEFPYLVANPNPEPLMAGITPEALMAMGIDPQPYIDLGFFDSPSPAGDATAPATIATPSPGPNTNGWNRSPVTVTLAATDNAGGSGVKEVHYSLAGATSGSQVVTGDSATVTISAEGTTTLTYFAVDNAGNQEPSQTLTVRINRTPQLTALSPVQAWVGLRNSDDVGTKFDLRAEVYKGPTVIGSGQLNGVAGGSSGFNNARLSSIPLSLPVPVDVEPGATLRIKVSARITCSGYTHASGASRLWFNDAQASSRFGGTIGGTAKSYYLVNHFALSTSAGSGPKQTADIFLDNKATCPGRQFTPFGTWHITLP